MSVGPGQGVQPAPAGAVRELMPQLRQTSPASWRCRRISAPGYPGGDATGAVRGVRGGRRAVPGRGRGNDRLARTAGHGARSSRARSPRRPAPRPSCSTATTTWCRSARSRSGSRRRSRRRERDGAIFGRGAADSKSNILMHVGALRAWEGRPPVGIKVVIEGQEETGSAFTTYPPTRPELFAADAMVIADMGSVRPGRADADGRAARHGDRDRRGAHARRAEAQRPVRRRGARRADRAAARARDAARRARRRGRRRPAAGAVDGRLVQRRGVPRAGRDRARHAVLRHRRPRRAHLVGPGGDRDGHRRAAGGRRRQRGRAVRAGQGQHPHPPRAGPGGGAGRARPAPRGPAAVRDRADGDAAETGKGFAAETGGPAYEAARAALATAWGSETVQRRDRAARSRSSARCRRRCPTPRSCCSGPPTASPTSTRRTSASWSTSSSGPCVAEAEFFGHYAEPAKGAGVSDAAGPAESRGSLVPRADARRDRDVRQQGAAPGDDVPRALRLRDRRSRRCSARSTSGSPTRSPSCRPWRGGV